ncbi:MAG: hypothetical protein R3A51_00505 [Nannocystaceae bacterium]
MSKDEAVAEEREEPHDEVDGDYGPPFVARSFGGEFVWAQAEGYTSKVLRVRAGENVIVSTRGRRDMVVMLTCGRAALETRSPDTIEREELFPAAPLTVAQDTDHRLVAMTDVELFVIYTQL